MSRIIIQTYRRGFRSTEEEAPDLAGRGQERIFGAHDIIHLGQAREKLEGVGHSS